MYEHPMEFMRLSFVEKGITMKLTGIFLVFLLMAAWPTGSSAEFYRYYDENGALRFTDNIAEVPEDQRPQVKTYAEEDDYLTPKQRADKARKAAEAQQKREKLAVHQGKTSTINKVEVQSVDDLQSVQQQLNEDRASLDARREELRAERDTLRTASEVRAYQKKVRTLNEDINRFEKRRQEFIKKAKQYNALPE